ncbi:MAG TPA: TetR/AcrR family transcriptional regulator [Caulobacterales bacterium]|nr:TetR/AcrR family transcriptional regulator [Caulobacterales bacterium]
MTQPPESAPKWRRRAEARPEEILDAALSEFTERGFDAARMEDIARRAGLSKGGVYLYFEGKEALLKALIEAKIAPIAHNARMIAQAGAQDPLGSLRMLARMAAHRFADPKVFAVPRLVIGLSARFPEIAAHYRTQVVEVAKAALETLIAAAVERGELRPVEPRAAVRAFIAPFLFEAMWTHVLHGEGALAAPETLVEQHFDVLLRGLAKERSQ